MFFPEYFHFVLCRFRTYYIPTHLDAVESSRFPLHPEIDPTHEMTDLSELDADNTIGLRYILNYLKIPDHPVLTVLKSLLHQYFRTSFRLSDNYLFYCQVSIAFLPLLRSISSSQRRENIIPLPVSLPILPIRLFHRPSSFSMHRPHRWHLQKQILIFLPVHVQFSQSR